MGRYERNDGLGDWVLEAAERTRRDTAGHTVVSLWDSEASGVRSRWSVILQPNWGER